MRTTDTMNDLLPPPLGAATRPWKRDESFVRALVPLPSPPSPPAERRLVGEHLERHYDGGERITALQHGRRKDLRCVATGAGRPEAPAAIPLPDLTEHWPPSPETPAVSTLSPPLKGTDEGNYSPLFAYHAALARQPGLQNPPQLRPAIPVSKSGSDSLTYCMTQDLHMLPRRAGTVQVLEPTAVAKRVRFYPRALVYRTFSPSEYDRGAGISDDGD
ncbi:hypothetical protein DFJ74DRAFT_650503, partial [Hyaloraphidium curvatum]